MENLHENINQLEAITSELTDFVFDNEGEFLQVFAKFDALDLTEVSFSSKYVRFTYVEDGGADICDNVCIKEFEKWCSELIESEKVFKGEEYV